MFLSKFDFISPEINLFYKGKERHSSIASGILSILLFFFIIFLIIYLSIDCIGKINPTSFYFTKYIDDVSSYPLNSSSLLHYIGLYDAEGNQIVIDTKAINVIGVNINDGIFTEDNDISKYSIWIYESCEENDLGNLKEIYKEKNLKNFYNSLCISKYYDLSNNKIIDKNDVNFIYPTLIHGASQSNNFEYGVYIQKCQNNTYINNNNCYSSSGIENFLKNVIGYEIYFIDHSVNVEDYKNPIITSIHRITSEINSQSYVLNHLNFHPVSIRTNDGLILDNNKEDTTFNFDVNEKITHINSSKGILGTFNFWMQNTVDTYDRTYKKIQDIAGGVDGIIEIVMIITRMINQIFIHDFILLNDFNYEFNKINPNKNKSYIMTPRKKKYNKIIADQAVSVVNDIYSKKNITKRNGFVINSSINNSSIDVSHNYTLKKKNTKLTWCNYIMFTFKFKNNKFLEFLNNKREEYISEEKLLELTLFHEKNNEPKNDFERFDTNNMEDNNNYNNITNTISPIPLTLNK